MHPPDVRLERVPGVERLPADLAVEGELEVLGLDMSGEVVLVRAALSADGAPEHAVVVALDVVLRVRQLPVNCNTEHNAAQNHASNFLFFRTTPFSLDSRSILASSSLV